MKLSEAIRLGSLFVEENKDVFMVERDGGRKCGCALGTGAYAKGFSAETLYPWRLWSSRVFLKAFPEYPAEILSDVSYRHFKGESRLSIADWLEREVEPSLTFQEASEPAPSLPQGEEVSVDK